MTYRVGQGFLRNANNLAFNTVAEPGQVLQHDVDRDIGGALTEIREAFDGCGHILAVSHVRTKRRHRSTRLGHMRTSEIDRRLERRGDLSGQGCDLPLSRLK